MTKRKFLLTLFLLSLLTLALRLYRLGQIPIALHWDEASWGYNAYSILKTGRDEYGRLFPLIFKAFGDYKAPAYVYLTSLAMLVFGPTPFAVRFPAAFFGALNVFLLGLFVKTFFAKKRQSSLLAIFSGLLLAFSPWHYDYSHGAWEINVLFAFFLAGLIFFLKSLKGNRRFLFFSIFFFSLCFYVYNSAKLILPLTALGLVIFFRRQIFTQFRKKTLLLTALFSLLMVAPVIWQTLAGGAGNRLKIISAFSYDRPQEETKTIVQTEGAGEPAPRYQIFYGDLHYFFRSVFHHYLNHFSPRFLFFEGDWNNPRHGVPNLGVLNYLDLILLPLGIIYLLQNKKEFKEQSFLWYFLLVSPLPSAMTRDIIQSLRAYFMVFPLTIISAFGLFYLLQLLAKLKRLKIPLLALFASGYLFAFALFWDQYFVHAAPANSQFWQYGYQEASRFVAGIKDNYQKIVFTTKYGQPYIFYLLYNLYPPSDYQSQAFLTENNNGDVGTVRNLDNLEFRELYWPSDRSLPRTLYIGATYEIPDLDLNPQEARVLKDIYFLDGQLAFRIVETLPISDEK